MYTNKVNGYLEGHTITDFSKLVQNSGMKPIAYSGHIVKAFTSPEDRVENEDEFKKALDMMESVQCPLIVFGGDSPPDTPAARNGSEEGLAERDRLYRDHLAHFSAQVAKLADLAKPRGVSLALEINWCTLCHSVATAAEIIDMTNRGNVGLLFDTAHFACSLSRLADLDSLEGRIIAGHLNDMRSCPPEVRNVNSDRLIPGKGALPLIHWLNKVEEKGFYGWHAVEIFSNDLWAEPPLEIAQRVMAGCRQLWPKADF